MVVCPAIPNRHWFYFPRHSSHENSFLRISSVVSMSETNACKTKKQSGFNWLWSLITYLQGTASYSLSQEIMISTTEFFLLINQFFISYLQCKHTYVALAHSPARQFQLMMSVDSSLHWCVQNWERFGVCSQGEIMSQ